MEERRGHRMYFAALVLPGELNEQILPIKRMMQERYGCRVGLKSPAHITLLPPFWMHPDLESELRQTLDRAEKGPAFPLTTAGFSAFRPRTIFIAVHDSDRLNALKKRIDARFPAGNPFGVKLDSRPFHPHVTIATRDLHKRDFAEVWPEFEGRAFSESWIVDAVALLRHNGATWDVVFQTPLEEEGA